MGLRGILVIDTVPLTLLNEFANVEIEDFKKWREFRKWPTIWKFKIFSWSNHNDAVLVFLG